MENNSRLFVGNLSFQTLESDLESHFSQAGAVVSVNLMLDKFTGRSRGFAFVEMGSPEEAQNAVNLFHGQELGGRPLTVNIARPREGRPPGARSGFGGDRQGFGGGNPRRGAGPRGGYGQEGDGGWRGDRGHDRGGRRGGRGDGQWAGDRDDRY